MPEQAALSRQPSRYPGKDPFQASSRLGVVCQLSAYPSPATQICSGAEVLRDRARGRDLQLPPDYQQHNLLLAVGSFSPHAGCDGERKEPWGGTNREAAKEMARDSLNSARNVT